MTDERYPSRGFRDDGHEETVSDHSIAATKNVHHLGRPLSAAEIGQQFVECKRSLGHSGNLIRTKMKRYPGLQGVRQDRHRAGQGRS